MVVSTQSVADLEHYLVPENVDYYSGHSPLAHH